MRQRLFIAVLAALALVVSACSGSADDQATTETIATRRTTDRQLGQDPGVDPNRSSDDAGAEATGPREARPDAIAGEVEPSYDAATATTYAPERPSAHHPDERESPPDDVFFRDYGVNGFVDPDRDPQSTFALDVDTGSYTLARRWLQEGHLPDPSAVRVEEFVNYFAQDYDSPTRDTFAVYADGGPTPFLESDLDRVIRIGIKAADLEERDRREAVLTFVVDVSGSMNEDNRIRMVREALSLLVEELDADDSVAIVAYNQEAWRVLDPTPVRRAREILLAIDDLAAGGSTNAEAGLSLGYRLAREAYRDDAINRVVLASDGVANVGETNPEGILRTIEQSSEEGIHLVTVGVGLGNYNDVLLEQLADQGDGFYAYVDTLDEAHRLFSEDLTGTLQTVAMNAKVQVEFNPDVVEEYRLIGFENRDVADEDFRNDQVDAGELGAGHNVTALYEVRFRSAPDRLRSSEWIADVALRWEDPDTRRISEVSGTVTVDLLVADFDDTTVRFRQDVLVAAFADVLRAAPWAGHVDASWIAEESWRLSDLERRDPDVVEFVDLVYRAAELGA